MKESLFKTPLQIRALETARACIGNSTPEGRYIISILETKARGAEKRQGLKQRRRLDPKHPQKESLKKLVHDLDAEFSRYIRLRDTTLCDDGIRRGNCVTCGSYHTYAELENSHWITRLKGGKTTTRWNRFNCHAACANCNKWKGGKPVEHEAAIRKIHGQDVPERLLAMHKFGKSADRIQMEKLLEEYKAKADAMDGK